jgi:hypothetical protein
MARGKASGYTLKQADVPLILGMSNRGDRDHDIAAWFGVNQGRIAEAKDGKHGVGQPAPANTLPPKGPPGVKGRRLRTSVDTALSALAAGDVSRAIRALEEGRARYDANEA